MNQIFIHVIINVFGEKQCCVGIDMDYMNPEDMKKKEN